MTFLEWIKTDAKTTGVAILYGTYEIINTMPDIYTMTGKSLMERVARVGAVVALGVLSRDRKPADPKP